jgi:transcriptional regulator with XRE-family HTH domain
MPKRVRKSVEFGKWIKLARMEAGLTQKEVAQRLGFTQPYWSKIEQRGIVPNDEHLALICEILGRSPEEAKGKFDSPSKFIEIEHRLEKEFEEFKNWLEELPRPVHIYVIRQDAEPVDKMLINMHYELLRDNDEMYISILFRYSDREIWSSFIELATSILALFKISNPKTETETVDTYEARLAEMLNTRFAGYHRKPSYEENRSVETTQMPIPMSQPVALIVPRDGPRYIFTYGYHWETAKEPRSSTSKMPHENLVLSVPVDPTRAQSFLNWILLDVGKPSGDRWKRIFPVKV